MAGKLVRAAVVGASTLLGKELAEEMNAAMSMVWDLKLLDSVEAAGQMTAAGDEALLIQTIEPGSFAGVDVVFFAGDAATTKRHWKEAAAAGAAIVDVSGALDDEAGALLRCAWVAGGTKPGLTTQVVVPAQPAAVMLALVMTRLRAKWKSVRASATVFEPASQQGSAGLDELHRQTVAILSFQSLPKDLYDAQVAFNFNVALGEAAKVDLKEIAANVRRSLVAIAGDEVSSAVAMQLLMAPVFNGYTASVFVEMDEAVVAGDVESALEGGVVSVTGSDLAPSNLSATEQGQLLVSVSLESAVAARKSGFWLWMAADNLKLAAQNAVACAAELVELRPAGKVQ